MKKILMLYKKYKEVINYLIFGVLATVVSLGVYYILTNTVLNPKNSIELQVANVVSWMAAVSFAYITNRKFVFESNNSIREEIVGFVGARLLTLVMDVIIMGIFVSVLHFDDKLIKVISQFVVIVSNYILSKLFVFKDFSNEEE